MIATVRVVGIVLAVTSAALVAWMSGRRLIRERRTRRRALLESKLKPVAWEFADTGDPVDLPAKEMLVLAELIQRIRGQLAGVSNKHLTGFFEDNGFVDRDLRRLRSRLAWKRVSAASRLGDLGSDQAIDALMAALRDKRLDVRAAAARSLGKMKSSRSVPALVQAMADRTVPRQTAAHALLQIGDSSLDEIRGQIRNADPQVRAIAVGLTGLLGDVTHAGEVSGLLKDSSADVRASAARALGRLGDDRTAIALRKALKDRIGFVRTQVANALGRLGDLGAIPQLLEMSLSADFWEARAASRALASIDKTLIFTAAERPTPSAAVIEASDRLALMS
jgi:HEAT repeat protein